MEIYPYGKSETASPKDAVSYLKNDNFTQN